MSEPDARDRFVWHELMTTGPAGSGGDWIAQCLDPQRTVFALRRRKA